MRPNYAIRDGYKSSGFGYASDMIHIAVNYDDPDGFMRFLEECGGPDVEVLISGSIFNFAATHGATECLKALFASGAKSQHDLDYWLKIAEDPRYGPKAGRMKFTAAA